MIARLALLLSVGLLAAANAATPSSPSATSDVKATPAAAPDKTQALERQLAQIEDTGQLERIANRLMATGKNADAALAWKRLSELRPHLGLYKLAMAAAYAVDDRKSEAYTALLDLQQQGYAYQLKDDARFKKIATTEVWEYILKGFDANRQTFGKSELAYTLPKQDLLLESLAWDPLRGQLLAGSARKGAVYTVDKKGALQPLVKADAENGLWAVFDIAVDSERNLLWVASTAVPHFQNYNAERDLGRAGIFKFDLKTGNFKERFLSPVVAGQSFFISSLALGKHGEVYAADGINNAVYVVRDGEFKRLFHAPRLSSIRGMAVSGDGNVLYLGDHERGIIGFDLAAGKPFDVRVPKNLALGGIDGLLWWKGYLLVVQNGMAPNRVMRLKLSGDGHDITEVAAAAGNIDAFTLPTFATLAGDQLYVIANSQKSNYDRFGLVIDSAKLEGTKVFRVDVTAAVPLQQSNMQAIGHK